VSTMLASSLYFFQVDERMPDSIHLSAEPLAVRAGTGTAWTGPLRIPGRTWFPESGPVARIHQQLHEPIRRRLAVEPFAATGVGPGFSPGSLIYQGFPDFQRPGRGSRLFQPIVFGPINRLNDSGNPPWR
jgi:hypothetical protein